MQPDGHHIHIEDDGKPLRYVNCSGHQHVHIRSMTDARSHECCVPLVLRAVHTFVHRLNTSECLLRKMRMAASTAMRCCHPCRNVVSDRPLQRPLSVPIDDNSPLNMAAT